MFSEYDSLFHGELPFVNTGNLHSKASPQFAMFANMWGTEMGPSHAVEILDQLTIFCLQENKSKYVTYGYLSMNTYFNANQKEADIHLLF